MGGGERGITKEKKQRLGLSLETNTLTWKHNRESVQIIKIMDSDAAIATELT